MARKPLENALVYLPSVLAIGAGLSGVLSSQQIKDIAANPIIAGFLGNECHRVFRHLLGEITRLLSKNKEIKLHIERSARRAFIQSILAVCAARRQQLEPSSLRGIKRMFFSNDSEVEWLIRVDADYHKDLAATERDDYEVPYMTSEKEAFDFISTEEGHPDRIAAMSSDISKQALIELKLFGPVPAKVEEMIVQGWSNAPDGNSQHTGERLTLFKFMCAFFAEELQQEESKVFPIWSAKILKNIHLKVEDFSDKFDKRDVDFAEHLKTLEAAIERLNLIIEPLLPLEGLRGKIEALGEQISARLDKLTAQTEAIVERVSNVERILTARQGLAEKHQVEQLASFDELRREVRGLKAYLLQFSDDDERHAALLTVRRGSLTRKWAGGKVARQIEELLAEHKFLAGRNDVLTKLSDIVTKPQDVLLITAKPGYGKTALLANWVKGRHQRDCFIAYHFFSTRYITLRSWEDGLRNLLRQLCIYHGLDKEETALPTEIMHLYDAIDALLNEVRDEPLVIVLDGLDEAETEREQVVSPQFALPLRENVCIIASARAEVDEEPSFLSEWLRKSRRIHLGELTEKEDFADWLRLAGNGELEPCTSEAFVVKAKAKTEGYPLYLSYLTEELIDKAHEIDAYDASLKCLMLESELDRKPARFTHYVKEKWAELCERHLHEPGKQNLFALLAVAHGPIPQIDVEAVTDLQGGTLTGLPRQVTRWFTKTDHQSNDALYTFGHPRLAEEFSLPSELGKSIGYSSDFWSTAKRGARPKATMRCATTRDT